MIADYLKSFNLNVETQLPPSTTKTLKKGEFFIKEGERCDGVAFVVSGIFRSFHIAENGDERTYCIIFPQNFITAYSSYITGEPTVENIQAITDATLVLIKKEAIEEISNQNIDWMRFMKITAEQQYLELEKRVFQLQNTSAIERYQILLKDHPEYVQFIPMQYLASYLGITQRHLSRIRKELVSL